MFSVWLFGMKFHFRRQLCQLFWNSKLYLIQYNTLEKHCCNLPLDVEIEYCMCYKWNYLFWKTTLFNYTLTQGRLSGQRIGGAKWSPGGGLITWAPKAGVDPGDGVWGAHPSFCHKNTKHLCLALEASKIIYYFIQTFNSVTFHFMKKKKKNSFSDISRK